MWKNHFLWRTHAQKVFRKLLRVGLKSKKHVKKTFFQLGSRFFGPYNFDPVFGQFLKKKIEISEIEGFLDFLTVFKLFLHYFHGSETPKHLKNPKNSSKSRFWNFFFHIRSFFIDLTEHFERGISPCSTFQNSPMTSKNSVWGTIRH